MESLDSLVGSYDVWQQNGNFFFMAFNKFLSARWEYLAMFNYEVDAAVLQPHLPPYTVLDLFNGKAIVSVVGFLFKDTRVLGVKWPGFVNFEEVNLRYYIKHFDGTDWKRGVGFVSEIVPSSLVAGVANFCYNEHYSTAKMEHAIKREDNDLHVTFRWKKLNADWNTLWLKADPVSVEMAAGSEEEFIFEHYFGYNKLNNTTTIEYSLEHPRWEVHPVRDFRIDCDFNRLYGADFAPFIQGVKPVSVFLGKGSKVIVKMPGKIKH